MKNINKDSHLGLYTKIQKRVFIYWQHIKAYKVKLRLLKMINGPEEEARMYIRECVHGFHGKLNIFNGGYALLRNAIVREYLLRCHGRMPINVGAYLAKWNYNGGHNGSIDPSLMRLS